MENNKNIKVSKYYAKELFNQWGEVAAESVTELPKTDCNFTFLIKSSQKNYFLRVFCSSFEKKMAYEKVMFNKEVEIYKLLSERQDIKTPKILFIGTDSEGNVTHFITEGYDVPYQKAPIPTIRDRRKLLFQAGADIARVHSISGSGFGYDKMGLEVKWGTALKKMVDKVIVDAVLNDVKIDTVRIYNILERATPILNKVKSSLVHFGLDKTKIYVSKNFVNYQGISGWGNSFWGDFAGDFVSCGGRYPLQCGKNFQRGYHSVSSYEHDEEFEIRINIMKMYYGLLMVVEPAYGYQLGLIKYKSYRKKGRNILSKAIQALEEPFPT